MNEAACLNFSYDKETNRPRVDVHEDIWSDMYATNVSQSRNIDYLTRGKDNEPVLLLDRHDDYTSAHFNLAPIGKMRDPQMKLTALKGLMYFVNGLHAAAGQTRLDPKFMVEGSMVPAVRKNYALRAAVLWPTVPSMVASHVTADKMKLARTDLKLGEAKDLNVGAVIGPRTEATLFVSEDRLAALVATQSRRTPLGLQVLLKSETLPNLESSFVCAYGALALSQAAELA